MREATKQDLPKGAETQCPICWRMFNSDYTCERHKPWSLPTTETCKSPASLRFQPFERYGRAVWYPEGAEPRPGPPRKELVAND
jgi:hypothetical protein